METAVPHTESAEQRKVQQMQMFLGLLKLYAEDFKDEIVLSKDMLDVGVKTTMSQRIENTIDNPLLSLFNMTNQMDDSVKGIIASIAKGFLAEKKDYIQEVYQTKTSSNSLYYLIVLKEDKTEIRDEIFNFYDKYDLLDIADKYPVVFQFSKSELIPHIYNAEKVELVTA
jgi:hypothetical protein